MPTCCPEPASGDGGEYDGGVCPCGSAWFELTRAAGDEGDLVGVTIDRQGRITGRTGALKCIECGWEWDRPNLYLV